MEELRRLAFERMTDELEDPSDEEQRQRIPPEPMHEDAGHEKRNRKQNGWNAERVADPVHRIPMTGSVLFDPLLVCASAQHAEDDSRFRRLTF